MKNVCNETILCPPAEPDKSTHCYASWKNGTDGVELVMKGCWLDHESCYNKIECVASEATSNIYFCCCEGEMCNQNFSYRALPTPTEAGKMHLFCIHIYIHNMCVCVCLLLKLL